MNADWEHKRFLLPKAEMDELRGELCVRLGFCWLSDECTKKPLTIDEFTDVVIGGGGTPDRIRRQVRSLIADYYAVATNHGLWWLKFPENRPEDVG